MTDRPRAERIDGDDVLYDRNVGYSRRLSEWEQDALLLDLALLRELRSITRDQTPPLSP